VLLVVIHAVVMPRGTLNHVIPFIALFSGVLLIEACAPSGPAGKLESQLRKAANDLNSRQEPERTFSYQPEIHEPYYLVAATSDVTKRGLRTLGLPAGMMELLSACLESHEPFIAVVTSEGGDWVHPVDYPRIASTLVTGKSAGRPTEVTVRRSERAGAELGAFR
jgi:hypothetical protein